MLRYILLACICISLLLIPCFVYADCDEEESCGVDWDLQDPPVKRNGWAEVECPGGGTAWYWVTKYNLGDVGPEHCIPPPMVTINKTVPPGDYAEIDWPGYGPNEDDYFDPIKTVDGCWDDVTKTTNYYWFEVCSGDCEPRPDPNEEIYYTEVGTQSCCD